MDNREQETAMLDQTDASDEFDWMSDRDLLLSMARDSRAVKELIASAVEQVEPLLANPKLKLLFKML